MFFVEPLWLCILIPILIAPMPLGAALVIRQRRAPAIEVACLAVAGLAMAVVLGGVLFAVIMTGFVLLTHSVALSIAAAADLSDHAQSSTRLRARVTLALAVLAQIALCVAIARGAFIDGPLSRVGGTIVPFGVSYFAFHGISYLVDVQRRRAAPESSRLRLAVYLILLPQMIAGPVAFEAATPQLARRLPSVSDYSFGVRRLVIGLWKVFVMAALAAAQAEAVFAIRPGRLSVLQAWVGLAGACIQTSHNPQSLWQDNGSSSCL